MAGSTPEIETFLQHHGGRHSGVGRITRSGAVHIRVASNETVCGEAIADPVSFASLVSGRINYCKRCLGTVNRKNREWMEAEKRRTKMEQERRRRIGQDGTLKIWVDGSRVLDPWTEEWVSAEPFLGRSFDVDLDSSHRKVRSGGVLTLHSGHICIDVGGGEFWKVSAIYMRVDGWHSAR